MTSCTVMRTSLGRTIRMIHFPRSTRSPSSDMSLDSQEAWRVFFRHRVGPQPACDVVCTREQDAIKCFRA